MAGTDINGPDEKTDLSHGAAFGSCGVAGVRVGRS
jgi:hypothetical protein